MKLYLVPVFIAGAMLAFAPSPATAGCRLSSETPVEIQRKAAAREKVATARKTVKLSRAGARKTKTALTKLNRSLRVMLGLEESKRITTPQKLDWQLHQHQQQLRIKVRQAARARQARWAKQMN